MTTTTAYIHRITTMTRFEQLLNVRKISISCTWQAFFIGLFWGIYPSLAESFMTTIVRNTDIPENINTLERMVFHNLLAIQATIGASTFNLDGTAEGGRTPYISVNQGRATGDGLMYVQGIIYLPVDEQIFTNGLNQRPWMYAREISNNPYPAGYRLT